MPKINKLENEHKMQIKIEITLLNYGAKIIKYAPIPKKTTPVMK